MFKFLWLLGFIVSCSPNGSDLSLEKSRRTIVASVCLENEVQVNEVAHLFSKQKHHSLDFKIQKSCAPLDKEAGVDLVLVAESRAKEYGSHVGKKMKYLGESGRLLPFKVKVIRLNEVGAKFDEDKQVLCSDQLQGYRVAVAHCSAFVDTLQSLEELSISTQAQTLVVPFAEESNSRLGKQVEENYWFESMYWYLRGTARTKKEEINFMKKLKKNVELESSKLLGRRLKLSAR